jgi:hypothetical protein
MRDLNDINTDVTLEQQVQLSDAPISQSRLQWSALLEITIFLVVFFLIDHFLLDGTRFRQVEPHPFWIMVLLVSAQYGTRMGVVSAVAASVMFVVGNMPEQTLEQNMHEWFFSAFKLPIFWFIASVVIGEISVRRISMRRRLNEQLAEHVQRQATLLQSFNQMSALKEKLEVRIVGQSRTVRETLRAARKLENLDPVQTLDKAKLLVESMLEPEKFSIYILKDSQFELVLEQGWNKSDDFLRRFNTGSTLYTAIADDWKMLNVANADDEIILAQQGVLAGPLIIPKTGEVFGMLKIERHDFSQLSHNTIKDFNSMCQWIGSIYGRSIQKQ